MGPGGQPPIGPGEPKRNWFVRHKILSAVLALLLVFIVIGIANSGSKSTTTASTSSTAAATTTAPAPATTTTQAPATTTAAASATTTQAPLPTTTQAPPPTTAPPAAPPPATKPGVISSDQGFDLNSIKLADDGAGDFGGTARITNSSGKGIQGGLFKITILSGTNVVATMQGALPNTASGKTVSVDLLSQDKYATGNYTDQLQIDGTY